jgi:hypothetical protein
MDLRKMERGKVGSLLVYRRVWGTGLVVGHTLLEMWVLAHEHETFSTN